MKKEYYQYSGYRGRTTTTDKLRIVAVVLFVLVLLALGALLIGQRYIVYTDDGIRVELPFLEKEEPAPPEELTDIEVVVEPEQPEEEEPVQKETVWMKAVELPLESVLDGTAAQTARQLGANTVVLDMKTASGHLGYCSQLPLAETKEINYPDAAINGKLGELSGGEFYLIARVSCFRDDVLAQEEDCVLKGASGELWKDPDGVSWCDPAAPRVQEYLFDVMTELVRLGFDEILLDNWTYPVQTADTAGEDQSVQIIGEFLRTSREHLNNEEILLSVQAGEWLLEEDAKTLFRSEDIRHIWLESGLEVEEVALENATELLIAGAAELVPEYEGHQWLMATEMQLEI